MNQEQQAARDAAIRTWLDTYHHNKDTFPVIEQAAVFHGFDAGIAARDAADAWVAVKDSYPLRSATYYVTLSNGLVGRSAFYCGAFDKDVIAWLPIPEKPYQPTEGECLHDWQEFSGGPIEGVVIMCPKCGKLGEGK